MAYTTINKSSDYFNTVLWTTDGTGNKALTTGHSTDMVWIKFRDYAYDHRIYDDVRGVTKKIIPNKTDAESTTTDLASFDTNGFTVGSNLNSSGEGGLVGWSWKANGAGSSNTDGSITSTVSANTTSGFSIVTYTGTSSNETVGHGLGVTPSLIIARPYSTTSNWTVWHKSIPITQYLFLNTTAGLDTANQWQDTLPTSNVFYTSTGSTPNLASGTSQIAYCFAEKKGFSKFGSYTGNGNADGTFVYTGFKPAWIMYKNASGTSDWYIQDIKRRTFNVNNVRLEANNSDAEVTGASDSIDILSNGFKLRHSSSSFNISGNNYIYMAFAEAPLVGSNNVPCTAR